MEFDPTFRDDGFDDELWQRAMIEVALPPPGQYGTLRVIRESVKAVPLYGQQLVFDSPLTLTLLYDGDTLWMSDTPQERLMMLRGTTGMSGHMLVAGGGLGLYVQYLQQYQAVERITIVEHHPDVIAILQTTLAANPMIELVHAPFEEFVHQTPAQAFDCCYIDIHPTLDPRWIPGLNWLRNQCAEMVKGRTRIWGYQWMVRALVQGLASEYLPLLRQGLCFDDQLGRDLGRALPTLWHGWSEQQLHAWLTAYAYRVAWSLDWAHLPPARTAVD